jgi:GTP-binding protein Era
LEKIKSGFVTLIGLPNAGKSSFLNRLVGEQLAIVTPKPQTTWTNLRGYVSRPDLEMVVTDTPGLQEGLKALNAALAKNATKAVSAAREGGEVVAVMIDSVDAAKRLREGRPLALEPIRALLERECGKLPLRLPVIPTFNKGDIVKKPEERKKVEDAVLAALAGIFETNLAPVWVSATTGKGLEEWIASAMSALPLGERGTLFDEDALSDRNLRAFAAEYIREQIFLQLGEEIPYSIAVQIESFDESDPKLARIEATLHVERESQKPIVLGKGGAKIKAIGTKARERIERLLGHKVFLGLKVKVTPHWARESQWLERFGYAEG